MVRGVWLSVRSCELQTLAPRLPPFTDTPHPPSLICWASHELAGVGVIGRCVTAQPACAYPAVQAGTHHVPLLALHGMGLRAMQCVASCLVSLHQESRFARSQIIFLLPRRCCTIGNFFFFFSSLGLSQSPNTPVHSFPTRCRWYHFATTYGLYGLSASASACPGSHALPHPVVTNPTLLSRLHQALPKPAGKRKFICTSQLYIPRFNR